MTRENFAMYYKLGFLALSIAMDAIKAKKIFLLTSISAIIILTSCSGTNSGGNNQNRGDQDSPTPETPQASALDMNTKSVYKITFETGTGADSWTKVGDIPDAINVFDEETGAAAVQMEVGDDVNAGLRYELLLNEAERPHIFWDMKLDGPYNIDVVVRAYNNDKKIYESYYLVYTNRKRSVHDKIGKYGIFGLGSDTANGQWRTVRRDIAADFANSFSHLDLTFQKVYKIMVFANGLIDNISLSAGAHIYENGHDYNSWELTINNADRGNPLPTAGQTDSDTGDQVVLFSGVANRGDNNFYQKSLNDYDRFDIAWDMKTSGPDKPYYFLIKVSPFEEPSS